MEGVLSAVGVTYLAHADPARVRLARQDCFQPMLGEEAVDMGPAIDDGALGLAQRVLKGAKAHGASTYHLMLACAADDESMPEVVHRYLRLAFARGKEVRWLVSDPTVVAFTDLARRVSGEVEHTKQFVRFSHLSDGSWAATFSPKDNTIPLTAGHFVRRMTEERFCIIDPRHHVAAFHREKSKQSTLVTLDDELAEQLSGRNDLADDERYVRAMWKRVYDGLSFEGRGIEGRGYDLRMHFMPKRFWEGLPELDPSTDNPGTYVPERYRNEGANRSRGDNAAGQAAGRKRGMIE
ncbi:MAG: TIGR03915 family putative DNA repair protein [Tractidigestivibacter sp.]|uniref:TIGR03915 family putative DNA repair protein n=1 Tax=Tractidigestivibacter sp. TaxID=2847320 RepID=UPI003D913300